MIINDQMKVQFTDLDTIPGPLSPLDVRLFAERVLQMHWIEEHRRAKDILRLIQASVMLLGRSRFSHSIEASLL